MVADFVLMTLIISAFSCVIFVANRYFAVAQANLDLWKGRSLTVQRELKRLESLLEKPTITGGKLPLSKLISGDLGEIVTLMKDNPDLLKGWLKKLGINGEPESEPELLGEYIQ
jgi:hypothetical protein